MRSNDFLNLNKKKQIELKKTRKKEHFFFKIEEITKFLLNGVLIIVQLHSDAINLKEKLKENSKTRKKAVKKQFLFYLTSKSPKGGFWILLTFMINIETISWDIRKVSKNLFFLDSLAKFRDFWARQQNKLKKELKKPEFSIFEKTKEKSESIL